MDAGRRHANPLALGVALHATAAHNDEQRLQRGKYAHTIAGAVGIAHGGANVGSLASPAAARGGAAQTGAVGDGVTDDDDNATMGIAGAGQGALTPNSALLIYTNAHTRAQHIHHSH